MEDFCRAKTVRLRSHHGTYLFDDDGDDSARLSKDGASRLARWAVEPSPSAPGLFRLRSGTHSRYLSASDKRFLLGVTGHKVLLLSRPDPSCDWKPQRDGYRLKLQSRQGTFLRGNGKVRPYKGVVTHGVPHHTVTQEWVLWEVDVLEIRDSPSVPPPRFVAPKPQASAEPLRVASYSGSSASVLADDLESVGSVTPEYREETESESGSESESELSAVAPPVPAPSLTLPKRPSVGEGRTIRYYILEEEGVEDDDVDSFTFHGSSVEELKRALEQKTGLEDVILCIRDVINDKLLRLRLNLPPNRKTMTVAVVPSSSPVAAILGM